MYTSSYHEYNYYTEERKPTMICRRYMEYILHMGLAKVQTLIYKR